MDDLHITYDPSGSFNRSSAHGEMTIHMENFFPCDQARFKKLLKIIELDWQHEEGLKEELKVHFQKRISELTASREENGKRYFEFKQKAADTKQLIESRKHPNGLPVSKDELKQARADLKAYREEAKKALSGANRNLKQKGQFEKYLESM